MLERLTSWWYPSPQPPSSTTTTSRTYPSMSDPLGNPQNSGEGAVSAAGAGTSTALPTSNEPAVATAGSVPGHPLDKHVFGLKRNAPNIPPPVFSDDYEKRLPEDPIYQETAPNARVWRVYVEEAAAFGDNMIGQYRDGLDVMLVFAGLFSAVVTSFLVQASQNLQADFIEISAVLLHDLVALQLAIAHGLPIGNSISPSLDPRTTFVPDSIQTWINGLWATSLTISLAVALAAVLVKQWLHNYISLPSGTPGERSHIRQYRYMGLQKWCVHIMIGLLPITMHVSLTLFLSGFILYFVPLRVSLAWAIGSLTVIVCILYIITNTIPIFFPDCPYKTPLTDFVYQIYQYSVIAVHSCQTRMYELYIACRTSLSLIPPPFPRQKGDSNNESAVTLRHQETLAAYHAYDKLSVDALDWLFTMSSNPSVQSIVVQAIGGLPVAAKDYGEAIWLEREDLQSTRLRLINGLTPLEESSQMCNEGCEATVERLLRSTIIVPANELLEPRRVEGLLSSDLSKDVRHLIPAAVAACPFYYQEKETLQNIFHTCHATKLHPLLWIRLVLRATDICRDFSWQGDGGDELVFRALILNILLPPPDNSSLFMEVKPGENWPSTVQPMTLHDACWNYSRDNMYNCLWALGSTSTKPNIIVSLPCDIDGGTVRITGPTTSRCEYSYFSY